MWLWIISALILLGIVVYIYFFLTSRTNATTAIAQRGKVPTPAELQGEPGPSGSDGMITYSPETDQDKLKAIEQKNRQLRDQMVWFTERVVLVGLVGLAIGAGLVAVFGQEILALLAILAVVVYSLIPEPAQAQRPPAGFLGFDPATPSNEPESKPETVGYAEYILQILQYIFAIVLVLWLMYRVYTHRSREETLQKELLTRFPEAQTRLGSRLEEVRTRHQRRRQLNEASASIGVQGFPSSSV
jgi:Ca2+/Na+ antiporter